MKRRVLTVVCAFVVLSCSGDEEGDEGSNQNDRVAPRCGDGILDANEACEGFELRDATCESEGFTTGTLRCADDCTLDVSECTRCGNGTIEPNEVCEPGDLAGETCASLLGAGVVGNLACDPTCTGFTTVDCRQEIPAEALESCDPTASDPCADAALDCVDTGNGSFCLEGCDPVAAANPCGTGRFCYDLGTTGLCLDVPTTGEVCSSESGCAEVDANCTPTFSGENGTVAICIERCDWTDVGLPDAPCPTGTVCTLPPSGSFEPQPDNEFDCENSGDCNTADDFACLAVTIDGVVRPRCVRPYAVCAEPIPFFPFDGVTAPTEELACDRAIPTQGARMCPVPADPDGSIQAARVECFPLISESPDIGVCVGFCDGAVLGFANDGQCGANAECVVPEAPEFYVAANESAPVACETASTCPAQEFPDCLDVGRGKECVRPAKVCEVVP